jgi:hypothetical protein
VAGDDRAQRRQRRRRIAHTRDQSKSAPGSASSHGPHTAAT